MAAKVEQYIAETCKMQHSFAWAFRSCANRIFHSVYTIFRSFHSASHSCGSNEGSLQPSLWLPNRAAKVEQYIAETCKMQQSFAWAFRSCANRIFHSFSTKYCSFHSASHSCGSDEGSLQQSLWLPKLSSILRKLAKCSRALHHLHE